jgi:predicted amidohydrolase
MNKIKISTAQFENRSGDKVYNLGVIEHLAKKAAHDGSNIIAFHECSVTGYTFARKLSKIQMLELAELIP